MIGLGKMIKLLPPYDNHDEISPLTKVYLVSVMGCDVHTVDIKDINEFLMLQEPANVEDTTTP